MTQGLVRQQAFAQDLAEAFFDRGDALGHTFDGLVGSCA